MIPFSLPTRADGELALISRALSGDLPEGFFNGQCEAVLRKRVDCGFATLTPSCTHALELAAMCLDIRPGDQVIAPAFTFPSTANAFLRCGAELIFADIDPATLNLDPACVEALIGPRTRAVVAMHYAGVACDMDAILAVTRPREAPVVEDAAHGLFGTYQGCPLGSIGAAGAFSFHRTKNFTCGEGGAFVTNDPELARVADIVREKGTNRAAFKQGLVHRYDWIREGSSYVLADLLAAQLWAQLDQAADIQAKRQRIYERYQTGLADWAASLGVQQPVIPAGCGSAWHLYHLILPSEAGRAAFLAHLHDHGVGAAFHYAPLHLTPMGRSLGGKVGQAPVTERIAPRLVRLPFYTDLTEADQDRVIEVVQAFRRPSARRGLSREASGKGSLHLTAP
jgi:dTDP-4-amino-4,6-dideoxygalactose transaminase